MIIASSGTAPRYDCICDGPQKSTSELRNNQPCINHIALGSAARKLLKERGCEHYWDMASRFRTGDDDDDEEDDDDDDEARTRRRVAF